jgi:amino acid adenylation domain-containing protein
MSAGWDVDAEGLSAERRALVELLLREEREAATATSAVRPRARPDEPVPLSFAQHGIWVLEQVRHGAAIFNEPAAVRVRGRLDVQPLARALEEVIRRHETLRTGFEVRVGEPVQVVAAAAPVPLVWRDLRHLPASDREAEATRVAAGEAARAFDLRTPPLLRVTVLRLDDAHQHVVGVVHHLVADGWSMGVLVGELIALYVAAAAGEPCPLPPPPVQYADYAVWQREQLGDGALARQLDHWRRRLAGVPPVLELPADRPRPPLQTFAGAVHAFAVGPELTGRLRELALREGATLFMTLMAAFQAVLARTTGRDDVVTGTSAAGRDRLETEGLIGCFANVLAVRTDLSGDPSFRELLRRVRAGVLEAFSHQDVPFERLVEELQPVRVHGRNPLVQVLLVLHNAPMPALEVPGLSIEPVAGLPQAAKYDLTLAMEERDGGLLGRMGYATDLFEEATAARVAGQLVAVLEQVAGEPGVRLGALRLAPADQTGPAGPGRRGEPRAGLAFGPCLHQVLEARARSFPDAVALVCAECRLTYGELNRRANQLARRLRRIGVGPEALVALRLERSPELVVAIVAVLKAGGAYVPLDPEHPAERAAFALEDTGARVLVTDRGGTRVAGSGVAVVELDAASEELAGEPDADLEPASGPANLAYVIYTSGSTGRPKGVAIEHRHVTGLFAAAGPRYGFDEHDVWALFHSCAFDFSVWELWGALLHGGRLVIVPPAVSRSPERFGDLLAAERVTVLNQTPSAFMRLLRATLGRPGPEPALRLVFLGGEKVDFRTLDAWFDRHGDGPPRLVNGYGITETTVFVTHRTVSARDVASSRSAIGTSFWDRPSQVVDRWLRPVPVGVPGELLVAGAGVGRGYLGRPDLTAERFVPDPHGDGDRCYRSGDQVRLLPDGDVEYLGRLDDQLKIRGFRIEPGEIEAELRVHPGVREAVVSTAGQLDERRLVAHVVPAGEPPAPADLRAFLAVRLPEYMLPAAFDFLPELPLGPTGKADRAALAAAPPGGGRATAAHASPGTPAEVLVAAVWAEHLGMDRVGRDDNFFELGGNSVLAIQVHAALTEATAREFEIVDIFEHPTVRSLAAHLAGGAGAPAELEAAERRGDRRRAAVDRRRRGAERRAEQAR